MTAILPASLDRRLDPFDTATDSGACDPCGELCHDITFHPWPNTAGCDTSMCCLCQRLDDFCGLCEERVAQDKAANQRETEPFADNNDPGIPKYQEEG